MSHIHRHYCFNLVPIPFIVYNVMTLYNTIETLSRIIGLTHMIYDPAKHGFCSEFYTVVKTIEVVAPVGEEDKNVRIEVLSLDSSNKPCFSTKVYTWEYIVVSNRDRACWVDFDLPSSTTGNIDDALNLALSFLKDRQ